MRVINRCTSPACRRPFQVNKFSSSFSNTVSPEDEPGKIVCPHCGLESKGDMRSFYLTHALSPGQEAEFDAQEPGAANVSGFRD